MKTQYDLYVKIYRLVVLLLIPLWTCTGGLQQNSTPTASRVYGDYFTQGVEENPDLGKPGTLDRAFGVNGISQFSTSNQTVQAITMLPDGTMAIAISSSDHSYLMQMSSQGLPLVGNFGKGGTIDLGEKSPAVQTMILDGFGRFLVAGGDPALAGTQGWLQRVSCQDSSGQKFIGGTWRAITSISQQSTGAIIAAGHNNSNAQVARYTIGSIEQAGVLDVSFGINGVIAFDGNFGMPTSVQSIYALLVDSSDRIYVIYVDMQGVVNCLRLTSQGQLDVTFGIAGIASLPNLFGANPTQIRAVFNDWGNIFVAAQVGTGINLTVCIAANGAINQSFVNPGLTSPTGALQLASLMITTDHKILVIGCNKDTNMVRIDRLYTSGKVDQHFNGQGYIQFPIGSVGSQLQTTGATLGTDGRIYVIANQIVQSEQSGTVACVYNDSYAGPVAQLPLINLPGTFDPTFGSSQVYRGVVTPFYGLYGVMMMQKARAILPVASGSVLIGMDGYCANSSLLGMMLTMLTSSGQLDKSFAISGQVALPMHQSNESLVTIMQDAATNLYIAGYGDAGAIIRQYNNQGVEQWIADVSGAGVQALDLIVQGNRRVIACLQMTPTTGQIAAYQMSNGMIDTTFHAAGITPGLIASSDFNLAMGPVCSGLSNDQEDLFVVYKNSMTRGIDVAGIMADGSSLITKFGTQGIASDIFNALHIDINEAKIAFDNDYNIMVAACADSCMLIARLDGQTGLIDTTFNQYGQVPGILLIPFDAYDIRLTKIVGVSDGSIMLVGYATDLDGAMMIAKVTSSGQLDQTFASQTKMPGVASFTIGNRALGYSARVAQSCAIQPKTGNIVVVGYEQLTPQDAMPFVTQFKGVAGTEQIVTSFIPEMLPGTVDTTLQAVGAVDIGKMIAAGCAKVIYAYRSGNLYQGKLLVGIDTPSAVYIARVSSSTMELDTSFANHGIMSMSTLSGIKHLSIDGIGNIIVAGSCNGMGWFVRLTSHGMMDATAAIPANIATINAICQQQSGRYIGACNDINGNGVLVAWQDKVDKSFMTLPIDTTFNPTGAVPGQHVVGSCGLYTLAINSDDTIMVAYLATTIKISQIPAHGGGVVASFGTNGLINTGILPKNSTAIRLALDSNQKIIIACTAAANKGVTVMRYMHNGAPDSSFNSTGTPILLSNVGTAGITLTDCLITHESQGQDKIIVTGYNSSGGNGKIFMARLDGTGALDPMWNRQAQAPDSPGILTFTLLGSTTALHTTIGINGAIYIAGSAGPLHPLIMRIIGDNYVGQTEQQPFQSPSGTIDTTLDTITPGLESLHLNVALSTNIGSPQKIFIYKNGQMLIAGNSDGQTLVTRLTALGSLDKTFNSSGIVTIPNAAVVNDMYVANGTDDDGCIYVTGMHETTPWVAKINKKGAVTICQLPNSCGLVAVQAIRKSTNGRILLAGQNQQGGVIVAYNSTGSAVDLSFGDGLGYYAGVANTMIAAMELDSFDRIYCAYKNNQTATVVVARIGANGSGIDASFAQGICTQALQLSATALSLALDKDNQQVVVAVQDGMSLQNSIQVARFSMIDGTPTGKACVTLPFANLLFANMFIDTAQHIYVIGTNATKNGVVVARLQDIDGNSIELDSSYALTSTTPGIANCSAGNMTTVAWGALSPDRRVYLVGTNGTPTPYLARIFGDVYTQEIFNPTAKALAGAVDYTIDPTHNVPSGSVILSKIAGCAQLAGYIAQTVQARPDGTSMIGLTNGNQVVIAQLDADMNLISSFGVEGISLPIPLHSISSMIIDAAGKIVINGWYNGQSQVVRLLQNGSLDCSFSSLMTGMQITAIAEQKSGRIIGVGSYRGAGIVAAYKNNGIGLDSSFGPASMQGYYTVSTTTMIDGLVIDANDMIYIAYRNNFNQLCLTKLSATGSNVVGNFNQGLPIMTGIVALAGQRVFLAINNAGYILVGATTSTGIVTGLYNGSNGAVISSPQTIISNYGVTLTNLSATGSNFMGMATTSTNLNLMFQVIGTTGSLSTNFGQSNNGIAVYDSAMPTKIYAMTVQPDGKIIIVGEQNNNPILMRMYGTPYVGLYPQMPGRVAPGYVDTTLNPAASGVFVPSINVAGYVTKRLYTYPNGSILMAADNGSETMLMRLLKDYTVDLQGFNAPYGYLTIPNSPCCKGLYVNSMGMIFVCGGKNQGWMARYNGDGSSMLGLQNPSSVPQVACQIGQQSSSRIIVAGAGGSLYAYTTNGQIDTEFGSGVGMISVANSSPITGMSITKLDQIIVGSVANGSCLLQKISCDGAHIVNLNFVTNISGIITDQVKVVQDAAGNTIVAAATSMGFTLRRYTEFGTPNPANPLIISIGTNGTARLANIIPTSDGSLFCLGYDTISGAMIVTRINSNFQIDSTYHNGTPLVTTLHSMNLIFDAAVAMDNRLIIAGGSNSHSNASLVRLFGDLYVNQLIPNPSLGVAGSIDQTFGNNGIFTISSLAQGAFNGAIGQAIIPLSDGGAYLGLRNGQLSSQIIRITSENSLQNQFAGTGVSSTTSDGINFLMTSGFGNLLAVGTSAQNFGWISRYKNDNSGQLDSSFNGVGTYQFHTGSTAVCAVEQTMGRIIVAGSDAAGIGTLYALTNRGHIDKTFNSLKSQGIYTTGIATPIAACVADSYDRLLIAYQNKNNVDIARLTSSGHLDTSFGTMGIIAGALTNVDTAMQIGLALHPAGTMVVAAHTNQNSQPAISLAVYDNGSAARANGLLMNQPYSFSNLINPTMTNLMIDQDGAILLIGNQSEHNPMWVARLKAPLGGFLELDTTFNPTGVIPGIMTYVGYGTQIHGYYGAAIRPDGRIDIVGQEDTNPTLMRMYNSPYVAQQLQSPQSKPVGSCDGTFGLNGQNGITYFAGSQTATSAQLQMPKAVSLQDATNLLVALDGQLPGSTDNYMFMNMFDVSGLANQSFGAGGTVVLPHNYQYEYINDMYTFSTADVCKAILVGYAQNKALGSCGALICQYNVTTQSADTSFGGLNANPVGVVFGDAMQAHVVHRQSNGRIIVAGTGFDGKDILIGYTSNGLLDQTFGLGGFISRGAFPLYACAIDCSDRLVIAYNDSYNNVIVARLLADGSGLDTSFGQDGLVVSMIHNSIDNSNIRLMIDMQGNIIVAAVTDGRSCFVIHRYDIQGNLDATLTITSDDLGGINSLVLTKLLVDVLGKTILVGYDASSDQNQIIMVRATADLSQLDQNFNTLQTPGYIKYAIAGGLIQAATDATIHPDGRIVVVGAQA